MKLRLLAGELDTLKNDAGRHILPVEERADTYQALQLGVAVIDSLLSDTFTVLADDGDLLQVLSVVRNQARGMNSSTCSVLPTMQLPLADRRGTLVSHNESMATRSTTLMADIDRAIELLQRHIPQ